MNRQRVKELLNSNIESLRKKENASLNIIELFEITEHVAREVMGDTTPVQSYVPKFEAIPVEEKEISWITFKEFEKKYGFISCESLHGRDRFCPEFAKCCMKIRKNRRLQTRINEKSALEYFVAKYNKKDRRNPFINAKIGKKLAFIKSEIEKL